MTSLPPSIADQLLRRTAMLTRTDSPLQDVLDLAQTSLACGDADGALMLFGSAALERGFDDLGIAWQLETGARTGLWNTVVQHASTDRMPMLEKCQQEMRALLAAFPAGDEAGVWGTAEPPPAEMAASIALLPAFGELVTTRLRQLLGSAPIGSVAAFTTEMEAATAGCLPFDLTMHAGVPAATLARMVAFNRIRRFARLHRDLLRPPLGSAALLDHAARLSSDGLGPYFRNVSRLAKDVGGLLGLLRLANGGTLARQEQGRWALLLSVNLQASRLPGLVPTLGSLERIEFLHVLIARSGRNADRDTLWAVRDTCLAIGEGDAAEAAQAMLAYVAPKDWAEWMILGDLRALLGDLDAAEQTYQHCLTVRPDESQVLGRLAAIRSGDIKSSIFLYGFFARSGLSFSDGS